MTDTESTESNQAQESNEVDTFDRRDIMTKLVAAAALAATGLVSGEAGADTKAVKLSGPVTDKTEKVDKWNESYKIFKDSALKFYKMRTGFRVEIQATPELGATLRSMGLVPNAEGGTVKLSIEFSNS